MITLYYCWFYQSLQWVTEPVRDVNVYLKWHWIWLFEALVEGQYIMYNIPRWNSPSDHKSFINNCCMLTNIMPLYFLKCLIAFSYTMWMYSMILIMHLIDLFCFNTLLICLFLLYMNSYLYKIIKMFGNPPPGSNPQTISRIYTILNKIILNI